MLIELIIDSNRGAWATWPNIHFYSAVHNSGATLQNCPFCKFQVEFMICALIVYGQVIYFCKGFATRILLKKNFFLK